MYRWTKKWHILLNHCPIMHYTKFHRTWINIIRFTFRLCSITLVLDLKLMELDPDLVVNFDFQYYIVPHLLPWIFNWSWLDYDLSFDLHLNLWTSPYLYIYLDVDLEVEKLDPNLDLYLTMAWTIWPQFWSWSIFMLTLTLTLSAPPKP